MEAYGVYLALTIIFILIIATQLPAKFVSKLCNRFPGLALVPGIAHVIKSESARRGLLDQDEREEAGKRESRIRAAKQARLDLAVLSGNKTPRRYTTPSLALKPDRSSILDELIIKQAVRNGFSSHTKPTQAAPPTNMKRVHLEQLDYFSHTFQSEEIYRNPFNLSRINSASNVPEKVDIEEIVEQLDTLTPSPTILFLTGAIGLGKSTLAAVVIGRLRRKPLIVTGDIRRVIVPIDFESLISTGVPHSDDVTEEAMTSFVLSEIRKIVGQIKEATLSEHLARTKSRYIFIFDNLDLAYTEFCKRFVEGEESVQGIIGGLRYLRCLKYLISSVQNAHRSGGVNAPSALFCMRVDTMLLLSNAAEQTGEPRLSERYRQYTLAEADNQVVCSSFLDIVGKRGNLASALLTRCDEGTSGAMLTDLLNQVRGGDSARFRRYINLSVQGLRTGIASFSRYLSQPGIPIGAVVEAMCSRYRTEALGYFNGSVAQIV